MKTCLIIEDSEIIREITGRILADLGLQPIETANAPAALEAARERAPDVVFLDWDLPSMGALDFLRGAAALEPRPPIVLCATENDPQQFALAKAAGAAFHVLKPYDRQIVANALAEVEAAAFVADDEPDNASSVGDDAAAKGDAPNAGAA